MKAEANFLDIESFICMGGDLQGHWMEVDKVTFCLMWLMVELEQWTDADIPSDMGDSFFVCAMLAMW